MPDVIEVSKHDEFFLSIAKLQDHTFIMLGVMRAGVPTLFARIGKFADIDPNNGHTCYMIGKIVCGSGSLSRLVDEGLIRAEGYERTISYQAYDITYEQVKEFLSLIKGVEERQLSNPEIRDGIIKSYGDTQLTESEIFEREAMFAFVPVEEFDDAHVIFKLKKLSEWGLSSPASPRCESEIAEGTQHLKLNNTCRTTALSIFEKILGFVTGISSLYFIAPRYKTTLKEGAPDPYNFYILPPPPNVNQGMVSPQQMAVLKKLYKRLEEIPVKDPDSVETRAKFDALKATYQDIAGKNNLSAGQLLVKILEHKNHNENELFQKRSPGLFSRLFGLSSTTKRLFKSMEHDLEYEARNEKIATAALESPQVSY